MKLSTTKLYTPFIPYLAVLLGIYLVHNVWVAAIGYHLGVGIFLWLDRGWCKQKKYVTSHRKLLVTVNVLIGVCTGVLLYVLWPLLGVASDIGVKLARLGLTSWLSFGIYYCAVNPVAEELFWRRYLETPSLFPSRIDALFAGYHMLVLAPFMAWQWLVTAFVLLVFASWIWRHSARLRLGTPLIVASHFFADLGIVLVGYLYAMR